MRFLIVGAGEIKDNIFNKKFDEAIFINSGIEHFYKVNAPIKIWITKPSFLEYKKFKKGTINYKVRNKKKQLLKDFINSSLIKDINSILLITRNSKFLKNVKLIKIDKDKFKILNYSFINKILIQHLGFFYGIKLLKFKPLKIFKIFQPKNLLRLMQGYGPPRFWKASTGALGFLIMNNLRWKFNTKYKIFAQGITNPNGNNDEKVIENVKKYYIGSKLYFLNTNHKHEHLWMDRLCFDSLEKLDIIW